MPRPPDYKKASERASILWAHYNEHGKLLTRDVLDLIGQRYNAVYRTFSTNYIDGPPIWDSHEEKIRRKADALNALATKLKQDYLTKEQAALEISTKLSVLPSILIQIEKHNHNIPKITGYEELPKDLIEDIRLEYGIPRLNEFSYPEGLPVLDIRPGCDGKMIYRIR